LTNNTNSNVQNNYTAFVDKFEKRTKRNSNDSKTSEKKYEIRSMEELFLEDEEEKNYSGASQKLNDRDNKTNFRVEAIDLIEELHPMNQINSILLSSPEEIINQVRKKTFYENEIECGEGENNLVKMQGYPAELIKVNENERNPEENPDEIFDLHSKFNNYEKNINYELPISLSYDDEVLDSFENLNLEDFKKGVNEINTSITDNPRSPHNLPSKFTSNLNKVERGIKIEDYTDELLNNNFENDLENDYNEDNLNNVINIPSLQDDFSESSLNRHQLDQLRENKQKRPPTRYGNRDQQVLWENGNIIESTKNISSALSQDSLDEDRFKVLPPQLNNTINYNKSKTGKDQSLNRNINQQNLSDYESNKKNSTYNLTERKNIKKIYNLYNNNIHKKNSLSCRNEKSNFEEHSNISKRHISSEFREILKKKLSRNSDKIFENLRKLSEKKLAKEHNTFNIFNNFNTVDYSDLAKNNNRHRESYHGKSFETDGNIEQEENKNDGHNDPIFNNNYLKTGSTKNLHKKVNDINTNLTESKYFGKFYINIKWPQ
jgi:hypothetical protein